MNELQIFNNETYGQVRSVDIDGTVWFVASDVCKALEHTNTTMALERLDEDEKSKFNLGLSGGETNLVNEYGLYNLVLGSKKKEAKDFKRWITHEVIPQIRTTGGYHLPQTYSDALRALADKAEEAERLRAENETMLPKAEYFDELVDRNLLTNFRDTAKELQVGERRFIAFLTAKRFIYRDARGKLRPYAEKNKGLFELKEFNARHSDHTDLQTLITPRGRETFRLLLKKEGE